MVVSLEAFFPAGASFTKIDTDNCSGQTNIINNYN